MNPHGVKMKCALALVIGAMLVSSPAIAAKPSWAGHGKGNQDEQGERRDDSGKSRPASAAPVAVQRDYFEDRHRVLVREYYDEQFRGDRCPPGLAKKHNGCMPPGQARKWQRGQPLPREVVYYAVPQPLVLQIGLPPPGYRYVRVATDVLLIAIGTGIVVDAIHDLGR